MNTEKKLNHFRDISIQAAYSQSTDILEKYKSGLDEIFDNHKKEAEIAAKSTLEIKKEIIRKNIKKDLSDCETKSKRNITLKTNNCKEKLFEEVKNKISEYRKCDDYISLLVSLINDCEKYAEDDELKIYIDKNDSNLKNSLSKLVKADIFINDFSFGGGIRAIIPAKNILIDETFDTKLSEIKENYRINC